MTHRPRKTGKASAAAVAAVLACLSIQCAQSGALPVLDDTSTTVALRTSPARTVAQAGATAAQSRPAVRSGYSVSAADAHALFVGLRPRNARFGGRA